MNGEQERYFWDYYYDNRVALRFSDGLGLEEPVGRVKRLTQSALRKFEQGLIEGLPMGLSLDRAFSVMRRSPREETTEDNLGEQE